MVQRNGSGQRCKVPSAAAKHDNAMPELLLKSSDNHDDRTSFVSLT
jgi:hypothetical protein